MTYPNLAKAPIIEGLIDIQVKQPPRLSLADLGKFVEAVKPNYSVVKNLSHIHAHVKGEVETIGREHVGFRLERQDPPFVIHARLNELLVSRLRPYDRWENLASEARRLWDQYCAVCTPEVITRLATRFVNQVDLPLEGLDFDDYLTTSPSIPKVLPQVLEGFFTRIVVPDDESGSHIAISQAVDAPNPNNRTVPVLIDIDVYKEVSFPIDSAEAWDLLDKMRELKNRAFFNSVTEKALELFK